MTDRRSFLARLASMSGATAISIAFPSRLGAISNAPNDTTWDLSWLDTLKGKHRQVFAVGDLPTHRPLHVVANYLDAHRDVFGLAYPHVNAVVGVASSYPINASHAIWEKYELGRLWQLKDPDTGEWAKRNIYLEDMPAPEGKVVGVKPLQARGAIFWQCNNALNGVVSRLAKEFNRPTDVAAIRAELLANLNPGVKLVPAHTMLLGLAQEHGCTYEQIG